MAKNEKVEVEETEKFLLDSQDNKVEVAEPSEDDALGLGDLEGPFALSNGIEVYTRALNLREFLTMMRIVTRGGYTALLNGAEINPNSPNFLQEFLALFIFAVAEAEAEASEFVRVMVEPVNGSDEHEKAQLEALLHNPPLEDVMDVITHVIAKEGPNIQALGNRLATLMRLAQRVTPKTPKNK